MSKGDSKTKKVAYFAKLDQLLTEYNKIILVDADNVGSQQMHNIRISLRGEAVILMGKNTMIRKAMRSHFAANPSLEKLLPLVRGNIGFVFTNDDLRNVRDKLQKERVKAPAKAGALAPDDVFLDPQNTGMGPEKTSFFQALGIATKIAKGTIEINNRVHLIKKNEKVGPSEAALLNMLNVSPFTYGLVVKNVYDAGSLFEASMLDITDSVLLGHLVTGVSNIAAISLAIGVPSAASVSHSIINGFKNLLAIAVATEITFKQAEQIKEYLANPSKFAAAAPVAAKVEAKAAAAPAKVEAKKEESDEDMGFGLFD